MIIPVEESKDTMTLVTTVAPLIVGPLVTWFLKKVAAAMQGKIPASWQPVISAVTGALIGFLGGDAASVVTGSVSGLAGAKVRDLVKGKPNAISVDDKQKLTECGDFGNA